MSIWCLFVVVVVDAMRGRLAKLQVLLIGVSSGSSAWPPEVKSRYLSVQPEAVLIQGGAVYRYRKGNSYYY